MLIGAHVSTAGGLEKAVARGIETDSDAIQIFNQSPRAWRPTNYSEDDFAAFREAVEPSRIESTVIHAVYLINCASNEPEVRGKSITALTHALRIGDGIGADGVVLHAGSRKGEPHDASMKRAAEAISEALAETERCRLLLENTAGTNGPLGRDFAELAELIELAGGGDRLGICVDCCHLFASGYEIRTAEAMRAVVDELDSEVGLDRLGCLHVNDSAIPLGGQRDKHADIAEGEIGPDGIAMFLSEPRFESLPALLETPGLDADRGGAAQVAEARRLRERGNAAR